MLSSEVEWVCFHGIFDFAYLLKVLTGEDCLPADEFEFQETLRLYIPTLYDVKAMAAPLAHLHGGLAKICQELHVSYHADG